VVAMDSLAPARSALRALRRVAGLGVLTRPLHTMSEYFVLPLTLLGIAAVLLACAQLYDRLFGRKRHPCCSFCGRRHSEVAKLIEGVDVHICNLCVKICSDVMMKECVEYRESFHSAGKKPEPLAASQGGPASPPSNSAVSEEVPPTTPL